MGNRMKQIKEDKIKSANKRLINESLPPLINFTEHEVLNMLCEVMDYNIGNKDGIEVPEKITKVFQQHLRDKGRYLPENPTPDPPGMMR